MVGVEENYGEVKSVIYYHKLPYEYETWNRTKRTSFGLLESRYSD